MGRRADEPLTPLSMAILLALLDGEQHGYALMREVEAQTDGALVPGTGSLYAALERLMGQGLIVESVRRPRTGEDGRRRYYRITPAGRAAARTEAERMMRVVEAARARALIGDRPRLRRAD